MDRNTIIKSLSQAYTGGLPINAADNTSLSKIRHNSNTGKTLLCVNGKNKEEEELIRAISFFTNASYELSHSKSKETQRRSEYCRIAATAIQQCLDKNQEKNGRLVV